MLDHASKPDAISPDAERYQVASRLEIIAILRSLIDASALVTVYFGDYGEFILTALLAVNPDFEELIIDYGANEAADRRLLQASRLQFVTQLDHIRIQFPASRAEATAFEGRSAFRVRVPNTIMRLQRREYYRIKTPMVRPLVCALHLDEEDASKKTEIKIFDLSCGGLALLETGSGTKLVPGAVYRQARIDLPDIGSVITDIEVMHLLQTTNKQQQKSTRYGCRFIHVPMAMVTLVQRYINKVERELKSHV